MLPNDFKTRTKIFIEKVGVDYFVELDSEFFNKHSHYFISCADVRTSKYKKLNFCMIPDRDLCYIESDGGGNLSELFELYASTETPKSAQRLNAWLESPTVIL
jgi:hypothetical protein